MARAEPVDREFAQRVRASFERQGIMATLGATLRTVEPGLVEIEVPFRRELGQQHGFFHAGVLGAVADSAGGYAAFSLMPAGSNVLTVEYKLDFLTPADGERIVARGKVVRAGRTVTVCQLEVEVVKGGAMMVCAVGTQTVMRVDRDVGSGGAG